MTEYGALFPLEFEFFFNESLTGNSDYWLVVWAKSTKSIFSVYYYGEEENSDITQSETYGDWPAQLDAPPEYISESYCIYCTYTVAGGTESHSRTTCS